MRFAAFAFSSSVALWSGLLAAQPTGEAPSGAAPPDTAPAPEAPPADTTPPPEAPPADTTPAPEAPPADTVPAPAPADTAPASAPADTPPAPAPAKSPEKPAESVEITVAGSRLNRAPGSAQVINRRQLERFEYDDPHAVLMQVPGVYIRQEDGVGLRPNLGIRGGNPDRSKKLTLMEDGILFGPAPYSAPAAYYFPLTSRMVQLKVIKGPAAVAYGPQTVGGAVDFVTRPIPTTPSGGADVAFGEYGYDKVHAYAGASTEQFGFVFEFLRIHNTGFKHLPDEQADTGATRNDWMAKGSYVLDPHARNRQELGVKLTYSDEKSNETYLGLTDADFRADPYQRYEASALDEMKNHRISVVLSHQLDLPRQHAKVTTNVYRHDYARIWRKLNRLGGAGILNVLRDPTAPAHVGLLGVLKGEQDSVGGSDSLWIGPNDRAFVSQGVQSQLELSSKTGPLAHSLQAGARVHYDSIERRHSENEFRMVDGRLEPVASPTLVTTANFQQTYALALHALDAITWRDLTLTPGARVELIRSDSKDRKARKKKTVADTIAVMPGVGAYYAFTDHLGILAGVYRGFSPPPPGDEAAKPEYSVNYEAGARLSSGAKRLEVIGFFNDYSNLTDVCTLSSSCVESQLDSQFSAGKAHIYGLEAYAAYDFKAGRVKLPFTFAYTLTRSKFMSDFESADPIYGRVQRGDQLPYIPRHQGSVTLGAELDYVGVALAGYHVARMREEASAGSLDDAFVTDTQNWLDVSAFVKPFKLLSIYGNLRNVTGDRSIAGRRPFGARPNAPRWLQVGAKLAF
jgi:Fe(3+) dicitrate transport protein